MHAPSVTNTLGQACSWFHMLSIEVFGSLPILHPPISWISSPGACLFSYCCTPLTPDFSSISLLWVRKSFIILSLLSSYPTEVTKRGIPHWSFWSLLSLT